MNQAMDSQSLMFRDTRADDSAALIRFAQMTLGSSWSEEFVEWKYFRNPAGRVYSRCAELEGKPVGFYGNSPVRLKLGDQVTTGAQAVDAMVAPEVRRQGVFAELARQTYRQMDEAGVALTYAFPNPITRKGFVERLAWTDVGEAPRYMKLLDTSSFSKAGGRRGLKVWVYWVALEALRLVIPKGVADIGRGIQIQEMIDFDERFDRLWQQVAETFPVAVVRDTLYLTRRYIQNPLQHYVILAAERDASLAGYAVLSLRDVDDGVIALAELLVLPGDGQAGLALLAEVTTRARQLGCNQLQCWMLPHHTFYVDLLKRSGFVFWPRRYLPGMLHYTTPFIIRPKPGSTLSPDPTCLQNWFLTMGDHDYY